MVTGPGKKKNEVISLALQVFLKTILAAVLSIFVYMSLSVIIIGMNSKQIGYRVYELNEAGEQVEVESQLFNDTITTAPTAGEGQLVEGIMSDPPASAMIFLNVLSEILMLLMLSFFIISALRDKGQRDHTNVKYGHMKEDKLIGLKIGLLAAIPAFVAYLVLVFAKITGLLPSYLFLYRYINICFLPIINSVAGTSVLSTEISWLALFVLFLLQLFIPLVCHAAYTIGYKQIFLSDKIVYKDPAKKKR